MCKLSQNIVLNVYNSLQSSFLSLAWPWPGRSLPKGNHWKCWDAGLGPYVVGLPVHLPPQFIPDTLTPLTPPNGPNTPMSPQCPLLPPIPLLATCTYTPCQPQYLESVSALQYTPDIHSGSQHPLGTPKGHYATILPLLAPEYLCSLQAPNTPLMPLMAPTPPRSSQMPPYATYTPSGP